VTMATHSRRRSVRSALVVPIAVAVATACGGGGDDPDERFGEQVTPAVEVVQARYDALPLRERLTGSVQASGQVAIYAQTSGPIMEVFAENGQVVEAGQPLVAINARTSRSQLAQAEAELASAEAERRSAAANLAELESQLARTELLAQDSLVSQEQLETQRVQVEAARAAAAQAEASVSSARATIDEREEAVGRTLVRAPISGVVGQRAAEVGMITDGQAPLFLIGRLDRMRVEVPIAQDLIGRVTVGQRAEIRSDTDPNLIIPAQVSRISPFLAPGSFSAEAEIDVQEPRGRLAPGMFVAVDVYYGESDSTTVVPTSALYDHPDTGTRGVYVAEPQASASLSGSVSNGIGALSPPSPTRFVPVDVIAEGRQMVGVTNVRADEWVVVIGQHLLAQATSETGAEARLRPSSWERIVRLQERQGIDLLREVMEQHRRLTTPAELPPTSALPRDADPRGS